VNGQELTEEEFNRRFPQAHHAGLDLRFADSRMGGGYNVTENWRYAFHVAPNDQEIHITDENNDEDWSNRTDDNDGAVPNLPPHVASVAETVIDGKRYWKVPPDVRKALSGSIAAAFGVRKHDGDMWVPFGRYEDLCEQTRDIIKEFSSLRLAWEVVPEVPSVGDQLYFKNDLSLTDKVGLAAMNEKYMGLPSVVENIWLNHTFGYGEPPYKGSVGTIQLVYEDNFGGAYLVPLSYWQEFLEYRDRTAGLKFSEVALPKGEQYDSYNLDTDIQPDETVQHSPTVRREKYDPVKYRLDWGSTNEEKFFEKGLHGGPDRKETERPLTPFGGLKLAWEVEERGSTAEDFYNSKIGDIWLLSRKDGKGKPKVFVVESVTYGGIHGYYGATIEAVLHYYEQKTRAFRFTASMDANYEDIVFQYLTSVDFEQTHAYIEAVDRGLDSYVDPHSKRLIKFAQEKPDITYPELDDVMTINKDVNDAFGTRHQVYDYTEGKVLGSIGRTQVGWGDWEKYPTIPEKAAVLAFDGVTGHWFVDGNHRTAFNLCLWFLHQNGCTLPEEKLEEFKQLIYQCGDQAPLTGNDQVDAAVAKEKRERDEAQMMEFMKQSVVPMDTNEIPEDIHEPT
jgi:death-on-curing protein